MKRKLVILPSVGIFAFVAILFVVGRVLTTPATAVIGPVPTDIPARAVQFSSQSGSTIHGWYVPGKTGAGAIVLMHGVRSNRLSMLDRARFLNRSGYSVLLFDFQAHGESPGKHITFGSLESRDAQAAVQFLREANPGEMLGVIAVSMGGASTVLAEPTLNADAFVLEMVYPTIDEALTNRITTRLGRWSRVLTPVLLPQLRLQTGINPSQLRPIDHIKRLNSPKLFIAGANDLSTPLEESRALYETANQPKEFWVVPGVGHVDAHSAATVEYEQRILEFFERTLR